jgi:1-acyl-sn-glycerol-3-phosphate acyltransferase
MAKLSATLRALCFVLLTLPLMPLQALFILVWPNMARVFPHHYHKLACRILGFKTVVKGELPKSGQCLIVSNHVSWIDVVVLSAVSPLSFVAKREVAQWPFFGWLAKLQRTVFVDREKRHSTKHSRTELEMRLAAGDRVVLFPEGTSHTGESVLPFKSSFFAAATAPEIAIVPVTLVYKQNYGLPLSRRNRGTFAWYADMDLIPHLWGALCACPLTVEIIIHPALDVETGRNRKRATESAEGTIRRSLATALHGRAKLE